MWFCVNLISLYTVSIAFSIKQKKLRNEIIIISNRGVFDYGYRDSTNRKTHEDGKNHKLHDKQGQARKGPDRQRKYQYH